MTPSQKTIIAAILAIAMVAVPLIGYGSNAEETADTPEIDKDLGVIWSYGFQFEFQGSGANAIRWNFGDGSPELYDDYEDGVIDNDVWNPAHYFPDVGVYYITLTTYNDFQGGSETTSVYKLDVRGYPYITLVYNNGQENGLIQQTSGESNATAAVSVPEDPVKEGNRFTGWYTNPECTNPYDWDALVKVPTTLYAGWEEIPKYTISFDVGAGVPPMESEEVYEGTEYTIPGYEGTNDGYTFGGWSWNGQTYLEGQKIIVEGDIAFTAVWNVNSYTVAFDTDGGSNINAQTVQFNQTATKPAQDPVKTGYTFAGWFTADGQPYTFTEPVTGNITVYAQWTINAYTVTIDPSNGTAPTEIQVNHGEKVPAQAQPSYSGHTFQGWFVGSEEYDFDTPVTGPVTITAHWTENAGPGPGPEPTYYTILFYVDGQPYDSKRVESGDKVELPAEPEKFGNVFDGWYTESGEAFDADAPVPKGMTLVAHWKAVTHTVTFTDGDSVLKTITVKHSARAGSFTPVKDGFNFDGWYLNDTPYDFATPVTSDITLTAHWTVLRDVTVDIADDVQLTEQVPDSVVDGDSVRLPEASAPGQSFQGWDTDGDGVADKQAGETVEVSEDTTFTPVFEPLEDPDSQHTVTIEDAPELPFDNWYVEGDGQVPLPEVDRPGQSFQGWDTDGDGTADKQAGDVLDVTEDVVLKPIFTEKERYAVTADIGDGAVVSSAFPAEVYVGQIITLPDASRQGYDLAGWEVSFGDVSARTLYQPGETVEVLGPMTVTAQWTALEEDDVQHTVTIDPDGGSAAYDEWYAGEDDVVVVPDVEERPGYEFNGFRDQDGNVWQPGDEIRPSEDTQLKAEWTPVEDSAGDDESQILYLIGAVIAAVAAVVMAYMVCMTRQWFYAVILAVLAVIAAVLALLYAGVI